MNIDLHILTWNESDIIRMVLRHYKKFCRTMYVYDNYSTDDTRKIAEEEGAIVKFFGTKFFDDSENKTLKNNCWRGSDADFVIIVDADEIVVSLDRCLPNVSDWLRYFKSLGTTIVKTVGWQIMSEAMPENDLLEIKTGFEFKNYAKLCVFSPQALQEINYGLGAHDANPVGRVHFSDEALYVLHYKHIGGVQRTIDRYKLYQKRLSKKNRQMGWGIHYSRSVPSLKQEWAERMAKSRPLI